jgi:hypothetical protein
MVGILLNKLKAPIILLLIIIICTTLINSNKQQSFAITYNYFSGAANSTMSEWRIAKDDPILHESSDIKPDYTFKKSENYILNSENDFGYIYVIKFAKFLFPWWGDINSIKILQTLLHILISLAFFIKLNGNSKYILAVLFACNPVIISYCLFPFYYYII